MVLDLVCLIRRWLISFLLMLMGCLVYHITDPLTHAYKSFILLLQDRLKLNDQGKQSFVLEWTLHSITLCSHTTCKGFSSEHHSIYGFLCLFVLIAVLKSDYGDNRFNCIFYGKTTIFLIQELIVVIRMSEFTKSQRWASFWLSLWIAASPLNMQPTSTQTAVEINLCISLNNLCTAFLS